MSSYIKQIQTTLKNAGYYKGAIDGIAGKMTVDAVNQATQVKAVTSDEIRAVGEQYKSHPENNPPATTDKPLVNKSGFVLGARSLKNLEGVHPDLVAVVKRAIQISRTDFTVIEGVRTKERQRELVRKGASKTMNSRHITGHAVDIVPVKDGVISWRIDDYYPLAEAMATAADELGVRVRWGGAWSIINNSKNHPSDWIKAYRAGGGKFIDGPHFELPA
ncbi:MULTISPECIES: M15 family metallopeptidase [unclassified Moraxella]|uniref:M15 family metallopeptidase n=1 Tax=unclassified Moraxella TaxID=2685852 RepID=UPI002B41706E|nr:MULTISPECIES: M15 family metallopeptidase [unclassified Moraxella]